MSILSMFDRYVRCMMTGMCLWRRLFGSLGCLMSVAAVAVGAVAVAVAVGEVIDNYYEQA
jgi:hypothetical protein